MPSAQKVLIAADHAAVELKSLIQKKFPEIAWEDLGSHSADSVDYPDFAEKVASRISKGDATRGILLCGSGVGMSIAANKFKGVRAALAESAEVARLSRMHNDSNVLCMGSRIIAPALACEIAQAWLTTEFSTEGRHGGRVAKISKLESSTCK